LNTQVVTGWSRRRPGHGWSRLGTMWRRMRGHITGPARGSRSPLRSGSAAGCAAGASGRGRAAPVGWRQPIVAQRSRHAAPGSGVTETATSRLNPSSG
jgi:hypothetical protein